MFEHEHDLLRWVAKHFENQPHIKQSLNKLADQLEAQSSEIEKPLSEDQTHLEEELTAKEGYLHREAVAVDIFANETLGGKMDETISSHAARDVENGRHNSVAEVLDKGLNVIQSNHGPDAQAGDVERAKEVIQTEEATGYVAK